MKNQFSSFSGYKKSVDEILSHAIKKDTPLTLYEPLKYILSAGGKRIRPILVILACEATGGNMEDALYASVAMELLHNFTLVHDDIMDNADTRRGKGTIHKKWNENVAILSGDHLIGMAYMNLLNTKSARINDIVKAFTEGILEVCEGQSFDKEFEVRKDVTIDEYIMMIGKKTAKMLETSALIGGLIGNGNEEQINNLKNYALNLGLAFQILDDLLDINSTEEELGKKIGGDLVEGKKTFLLIKAKELVTEKNDFNKIENITVERGIENNEDKILEIKNIYEKYGVINFAKKEIEKYTVLADKYLNTFPDGVSKDKLNLFSNMLMSRSF